MCLPKHKSYSLSGMIRESDRWGSTRDVCKEDSLALGYLTSCSEKGKHYTPSSVLSANYVEGTTHQPISREANLFPDNCLCCKQLESCFGLVQWFSGGDIGQCLGTILVVLAEGRDPWRLLGRGQGCCWTTQECTEQPHSKELPGTKCQ